MLLTGSFVLPMPFYYLGGEDEHYWKVGVGIFLTLAILLVLSFCLAAFTNPGYVLRDSKLNF